MAGARVFGGVGLRARGFGGVGLVAGISEKKQSLYKIGGYAIIVMLSVIKLLSDIIRSILNLVDVRAE